MWVAYEIEQGDEMVSAEIIHLVGPFASEEEAKNFCGSLWGSLWWGVMKLEDPNEVKMEK